MNALRIHTLSWQRLACYAGAFVVLMYLGVEVYRMIAPPGLSLTHPSDQAIVHTEAVAFGGKTTPETTVTINGMRVAVSPVGTFAETIHLKEGVNEIIVVATAKRGAQSQISRQVMRTVQ